ncbi:MAG: NAD(P)H-binding protein [Bdellovibrionaceae bacterium]|nr:NAD(P)H-binding protein [Pseudobdellovibrionaceae bacterium]
MRVTIAGASGFVGQLLLEKLKSHSQLKIKALSRNPSLISENITWQTCDLFSLSDCEEAMRETDVAIYLIHSMVPTARLDQGSFQDYDLLMADNFIRACELHNVKKIIYLGGMLPQTIRQETQLSWHLRSRLEVEKVLNQSKIPCVTLRAGMIVEKLGSSFDLFVRLVGMMKVIPLPSWSYLRTEVVDGLDVVDVLENEILNEKFEKRQFDLGCGEILTYASLLKKISAVMDKKILFFNIPLMPFELLKYFFVITTKAPFAFINPLVGSLKYEIYSRDNARYPMPFRSINETIHRVVNTKNLSEQPKIFQSAGSFKKKKRVRSVQRFMKKNGLHADAISFAYLHWLPRFLNPFLKVVKTNHTVAFHFWGLKKPLLMLEHVYKRSSQNRQIYFITGGLLAVKNNKSRLEFREVLDDNTVMAAIHEFEPSLPWWLYRLTQAPLHLLVMNKFGNWLRSKM